MERKSLKVGIIGVGRIGAAYAFALSRSRLVDELVLIDLNFEHALASAADLSYGLEGLAPVRISAGHWRELADADLLVFAAGVRQMDGVLSADLATKNSAIFRAICAKLTFETFPGVVVVASDPVDSLTMAIFRFSGLPRERVIGVGTVAMTTRLVQLLGRRLRVDPAALCLFVAGAGGVCEFPLWSQARCGGQTLVEFAEKRGVAPGELECFFRRAREEIQEIVRGRGAVCYAVVSALMRISRAVLDDKAAVLTVTTPLEGEYGCSGVSLGVPALVGGKGAEILQLECCKEEYAAFSAAADSLRQEPGFSSVFPEGKSAC